LTLSENTKKGFIDRRIWTQANPPYIWCLIMSGNLVG
jgi:hypothetical protein